MIDNIYTFDDIISYEEQMEIFNFVKTTDIEWIFMQNITGKYGSNEQTNFPANVIPKQILTNDSIKKIIEKIELKVIEKLNVNFEVNYRYKINWTRPLGFEYNPLKLLHIDNNIQHVAMIYYINDTTGATNIYNNTEKYKTYLNDEIDYSKFNLIKKIEPKMGRVVIFDGALHHYGDYPTEGDRYIINFNFVIKQKNKTLI
jgi:hypothetical protein